MKFLASSALALAALVQAAAAEVAVLEIRFAGEKEPRKVVIDLLEERAPETVENYKKLARKGFYKGVAFHRAFPDYMVQTGDPLSREKDRGPVGTGGPGYTLPAEPGGKIEAGSVVAARLPDKINPARRSSGSQFFIALQPMPDMSGKETVFGKVIEGLEVIEEISRKSTDSNNYPVERITIRRVKILPSAAEAAAAAS